jgi:hypothetical protein
MAEPMVWARYMAMGREEDGEGGRGRPVMTEFEEPVPLSVFQANNGPGQKYIGMREWTENPNPGNFVMDGLGPLLTIGGIATGANALFGAGGALSNLSSIGGGEGLGATQGTLSSAGSVPTEVSSSSDGAFWDTPATGTMPPAGPSMPPAGPIPTNGPPAGWNPGFPSGTMPAAPAAIPVGAAAATGALAGVAGSTAASALSRIINGSATADDYIKALGSVAGAGLGAYASNQQAGDLRDLAAKYEAFGAPSRARFEASMTPGFDPETIPGYRGALDTSSQAAMRALSTKGNPFGNPGGLIEANKQIVAGTALPAVQDYQRQNASAGGISTFNTAAPGAASGAIGAQGNVYNAIGYGIDQATQPETSSLDQILKRLATKSTSAAGLA